MILEGLPQVDSGIVALGLAAVTLIAGYAELKFKTNSNASDIEKLENANHEHEQKNDKRFESIEIKHQALDNRVMDKLSTIEKIVARIEGSLSVKS